MSDASKGAEKRRLEEAKANVSDWRKWGPYLSERQWGTVREDYSTNGDAWNYFSHDQARSRAYRWGEDGLAGISDDHQILCFALAVWNGVDPILKERLFGLTNSEGNHGEDVKEYYYYLNSTPTHSYMKFLYKYPQAAYPYDDLVKTNKKRTRNENEYELIETGVFDQDRYFDIFVEYAKNLPEDVLIRITVENRSPDKAALTVLPTLWFRNTWSWTPDSQKPALRAGKSTHDASVISAVDSDGNERFLYCAGSPELLFTENETNHARVDRTPNQSPYVKDAFHNYMIGGDKNAVNPKQQGTKAAPYYRVEVPACGNATIELRLTAAAVPSAFGSEFDRCVKTRRQEADEFYDSITPPSIAAGERTVMRQALAGVLWTKQYYYFDLHRWLNEHVSSGARGRPSQLARNNLWFHMVNSDVISMPDKWEYPWYAAWDLAFHAIALSVVDLEFAKSQLRLMLQDVYLHPNGQIPAYEWNFGDVNPPVHAWAAYYLYTLGEETGSPPDLNFLKGAFQKLLLNFTWWVNRKDPTGRNVFEGGFLGLDNIGVFDRSAPLPTGGRLEQADGTAWMALYCQSMLDIAMELAMRDPAYEEVACKFIEHFFWIAGAMDRVGDNADEMWDEEDGFFYDLLCLPDGQAMRLKVRSMVGLLPLCAAAIIPREFIEKFPAATKQINSFMKRRPDLLANLHPPDRPGCRGRRMLAILDESKLRRVLARMLDEDRFLSPYGIRSLSKYHKKNPYVFRVHGEEHRVEYQPAESDSGLFGGNSNWRGPVWFPVNALIIRALLVFYSYYGNDFKIDCPTGSGRKMTLFEIAQEISRRLVAMFLPDQDGRRPVFGGAEKFQTDPHWRDHLLFYEYFHGDNGAGIGASHQTGWTAIVARFIQFFGSIRAADVLREDDGSVLAQAASGASPGSGER
jgi:hypothetical protein